MPTSSLSPDVTFIGLGAIGLPMASQLARSGLRVGGVDPSEHARERARDEGILAVPSLGEAPVAPVVVVMVATPAQLENLVAQVLAERAAAQHWVIMSTVGPEAAIASGARLTELGARVVDAPVTGGVPRAESGELTIFASGDDQALGAVSPVLERMGLVRVVGARVGDGQAIKVINQHLCAVHIAVAAESLALASSLGLDPAAVLGFVETGAAASWMLTDRGPRMLMSDPPVRSQIDIFVKDTGLVAAAAAEAGAETPLLDAARRRFLAARELGLGSSDDSRVIETYPAPSDVVTARADGATR
ncbi:NAD(P)-dependent oxidoreductase [Compostimonas suwonensis]|uniref:3-hydroxyisobutyrate dehydrogenase n=1 Tax=Compostimonas suwonensis TaxID=1048394 RepID=A0A2M9C0B5_9MICO|nr:NAD(P)-dependent oxidoreductase [Compostimonas suwonensis]PJJ63768.1 3-hydroxyisobutyrate dehydrogenase [Compostimonas suwonensis]